eukprot:1983090-Alexandrium_andersonii.AAC.1
MDWGAFPTYLPRAALVPPRLDPRDPWMSSACLRYAGCPWPTLDDAPDSLDVVSPGEAESRPEQPRTAG